MPDKKRRSGVRIAGRLIGLVRPMLPFMLLAILMGVAGFLCAIFITVFGGFALLDVLGMAAPLSLSTLIPAMLVCALLRGVLRYAEQASNHYIAFKLLALIRDKVFLALRRLAPAKLETRDKGNLISMITTDIELLEVFYAHTISPVAIAVLVSIVMIVFLAGYHWLYAVIALCAYLVVGAAVPVLISRLGRQDGVEYRAQSGVLGSTVLGSLRGLREVLQYRQGEGQLKQMEEQTTALGEKHARMKRLEGLTGGMVNTAILFFSLAVLLCGAALYGRGIVGFEGVLIPFVAMIGSFGPTVALANLAGNLVQTFAAADRVLDILEEEPQTPDVTQGRDVSFEGIACRQVGFSYGGEPVLDGFDLGVPKGRILGIQGRSGSGKSTLLRLMMRFWDVGSGTIEVSGADVRGINTKCLRASQGFVTQDTVLFHDTIGQNVRIANLAASQERVEAACKKASIHEFIMMLPKGYDTNVGELGEQLSGGERQRIGLARAFLHDAPLLLLDEPTSNLDSLNEGAILGALAKEREGKTVVLVSHRASTLGVADEVVRMSSGRCS